MHALRAIVSVFPVIIAKLRGPARGCANRFRNAKARKCVSLCPAMLHVMYGEYVSQHTRAIHTRAAGRMHKVFGTITSRVVQEVETLLSPSTHVRGG